MKTYTFTKSEGGGAEETYTVKESKLKQKEKDLLLGILIRRYEDSPKEVQSKFKYMLCDNEFYSKRN